MATIHEISSEWQIEGLSPTWVKVHKSVVEYDLAQSRIRALEAERDALAADAARYRYLVMHLGDQRTGSALHSEWDKIDAVLDTGQVPSKEMFDAAIDAAMKGE